MIGLVGGSGEVASRIDGFVGELRSSGFACRELTSLESRVRVVATFQDDGVQAFPDAPVVDLAGDVEGGVAVLGSGVRRLSDGASGLLRRSRRPGSGFLDGAPRDLAAILADSRGGTITVGSTPGPHRWFVAELGDGVLVSTGLTLLAQALGNDLRVDRSYEDFLLGFGFLPDDRTVYQGVRVLPSGTILGEDGRVSSARPSEPEVPAPPETVEEARGSLHDLFFEALEEQAAGRTRHAVLLGGFDSALVMAGLRGLGHEVHAFTFSFDDPRYEQRLAESTARHLGARHHWVRLNPTVVGSGLRHFSEIFNQPAPQPHYQFHTAHATRVIAEAGHDHVFTGDGCDSVFLGYPTVSIRSRILDHASRVPPPLRRAALRLASIRSVERTLGHVARVARSTLRSLELPWPARGHLPTRYMDGVSLDRLRLDSPPPQRETIREIRIRLAEGLEELDPVRLAFHGNGLIGQSGAKVEGSVALSGIPQMSPYRDSRLKAFVDRLPVELLRPPGTRAGSEGKAILYDMVRERELLPDFVIEMPKQSPSDSPIDRWYAGPLRRTVREMLGGLPFPYDEGYVDQILSPKLAEEFFRERISLGHHAFQAIGILCSYASFTRRAP